MFTGIIDHFGFLTKCEETRQSRVLQFSSKFESFSPGESISVNGACLTVTRYDRDSFSVDVSSETLNLTNLANLKIGDPVNFERALRLGDRLGGHMVSGHVDSTATILAVENEGEYRKLAFTRIPEQSRKFLIKKGSIAVNGVSLTINQVNRATGDFEVMLIPHTLERTNLSGLKAGAIVNLEFDATVKTILERVEELLPALLEKK